jgi:hypothetical protein
MASSVAGNRNDGRALLPGIHQPVEEVGDSRASGAAHHRRLAREIRIGDCREDTVFLVAHVDELDLPFRWSASITGFSASPTIP